MAKIKDVPVEFEIDAKVFEHDGATDIPKFHVHIEGDNSGWERKYTLKAEGDSWTAAYQNQDLITIEDHDCELEITIHKPGREPIKVAMSLSDFSDLRTLMEVVHRVTMKTTNKRGLFGKSKLGKIFKKVEVK